MRHTSDNELAADMVADTPTETDNEVAAAESRAIRSLTEVKIGHAQSDGRDMVSEAIGQNTGLLALIANSIHNDETTAAGIDELYIGQRVVDVVRDYCLEVARFRGAL